MRSALAQRRPVDLGAADDHDLAVASAPVPARFCAGDAPPRGCATASTPAAAKSASPRDHDIVAAVQRSADRLERLAAHDEGLPSVRRRKVLRSEGIRQGNCPPRPITPFSAAATISAMRGSCHVLRIARRLRGPHPTVTSPQPLLQASVAAPCRTDGEIRSRSSRRSMPPESERPGWATRPMRAPPRRVPAT